MRRIRIRPSAVCVLALMSALLWPLRCLACSCPEIDIEEAMRRSKVVFRGRVAALGPAVGSYVHEETHRTLTHEYVEARMQVLATYKGTAPGLLTISTGLGGGDCGFPFELDEEYLIFAEEATSFYSNSNFYTDICTRSRSVEHAEADLVYFGDPQLPARRRRRLESALVVTTVLLVIAVGYWYALRRPKPRV
jgi:hypothetical protein